MAAQKDKNIHAKHRERMRKKFARHGISAFTEHELIEYMLFYAMPRGNTNEIAHRLEDEFGTVEKVVTASRERLLSVKGIGENTVLYLQFLRSFSSFILTRLSAAEYNSSTLSDIKEYFISMFLDADKECICAAGLGNDMSLVSGGKIMDGDLSHVSSPVRLLYDFSCASGCSRIVIAHNHPHSDCLPSASDVYNTAYLVKSLGLLDIELTDHIIVGKGGAVSLRGSMHAKDIWKE